MPGTIKNVPVILLHLVITCSFAQEVSEKIEVNQAGYLAEESKTVYVSDISPVSITSWEIRSSATPAIFRYPTPCTTTFSEEL